MHVARALWTWWNGNSWIMLCISVQFLAAGRPHCFTSWMQFTEYNALARMSGQMCKQRPRRLATSHAHYCNIMLENGSKEISEEKRCPNQSEKRKC